MERERIALKVDREYYCEDCEIKEKYLGIFNTDLTESNGTEYVEHRWFCENCGHYWTEHSTMIDDYKKHLEKVNSIIDLLIKREGSRFKSRVHAEITFATDIYGGLLLFC